MVDNGLVKLTSVEVWARSYVQHMLVDDWQECGPGFEHFARGKQGPLIKCT